MATARSCEHCGAQRARHDARFCEYCGFELPEPAPSAPPPPGPHAALAERFRALEGHPDLPRLMQRVPGSFVPPRARSSRNVAALAAFGVAALIALLAAALAPSSPTSTPLLVLFVAAAAAAFVYSRRPRRPSPALVRRKALVAGKTSTSYSNSGWGSLGASSGTRTVVLLEDEEGERQEFYPSPPVVAARTVEGDMGVACTQGNLLIDFVHVRV